MTAHIRSSSRPLVLAALLFGATATLAAWWWLPPQTARWLANRTGEQMRRAEGNELRLLASQLATMSEDGRRELVSALGDEREEVRQVAAETLREMVAGWRGLPAEMSAPLVANLAAMLPLSAPPRRTSRTELDAIACRAELAEQFLAWPSDGQPRLEMVYCCEQTLRWARAAGWPKKLTPETPPAPPAEVTEIVARSRQSNDTPAVEPFPPSAESDAEPLGRVLPFDAFARRLPTLAEIASGTTSDAPESSQKKAAPDPFDLPDFLFVPASRVVEPLDPTAGVPDDSNRASEGASEGASDTTPSPPTPDWRQLDLPGLLSAMREPSWRDGAEAELRRRGADELNLRVARAMAAERIEDRLRLVRMLPELSGVDTTSWLLLLARDPSPRVRLAAVQLLSTATESRIRQQLATLEQTEEDPTVLLALREAAK